MTEGHRITEIQTHEPTFLSFAEYSNASKFENHCLSGSSSLLPFDLVALVDREGGEASLRVVV